MPKINLDKVQPFYPFIFDVGKMKRGAFAAGRKITRIISFSKKKSPQPGDPRTSYSNPRQGESPLHCQFSGLQVCRCVIFFFASSTCRFPVTAGQSGVAGTVVLCVQRLSSLLPQQRRSSDLPALPSSPRLRGGSRARTQTSLCLSNFTEQHRGGCFGGRTLCLYLIFKAVLICIYIYFFNFV